jgi:hypothetical protein
MLLNLESPNAGAFAVPLAGVVLPHRFGKERAVLPESKNLCESAIGVFRELGRSCRRQRIHRLWGLPNPKNSWPTEVAFWPVGANDKTHRRVPPSEGNEARRDGRQEVVAP